MKGFRKVFYVCLVLCCLIAITGATAETKKASVTPSHSQPPAKISEEPSVLSGKIVETMNSGNYTYLLLENKGEKTWVAIPQMKVTVGKEIKLMPGVEMQDFASKTLNRK